MLPPEVRPLIFPLTPSTCRLPPLVEKSWLPETPVRLMLPPLVERSVDTFFGTYALKDIFSARFQSLIFDFGLAIAVTLLLLTDTVRSYFSSSLSLISSLVRSLPLFPLIYTSRRASGPDTASPLNHPPEV